MKTVYFAQGELSGKIKIGSTVDCPLDYVRKTIQSRSGEPVRLLGSFYGSEIDTQLRFKDDWSHGEWFNPSKNLIAYIEQNTQPHLCGRCPETTRIRAPWSRQKSNQDWIKPNHEKEIEKRRIARRAKFLRILRKRNLTPRQTEIVKLVIAQLSNKAIAEKLGIAEQTVKNALWKI